MDRLLHTILGLSLWLFLSTPSSAQLLYLGENAEVIIGEEATVTVLGDFQSEPASQLYHDGELIVTGNADLSGAITIVLRGSGDFSLIEVGGGVNLRGGTLTVVLAEAYSPMETTAHNWLTSETKIAGPFQAVNLPGSDWRTAFDNARHAVIYDETPTSISSGTSITTGLRLWPNPVVREITIQGIEKQEQAALPFQIVDASGRMLQHGSLTLTGNGTGQVTLADRLRPGLYYLRLGSERRVVLPFVVR